MKRLRQIALFLTEEDIARWDALYQAANAASKFSIPVAEFREAGIKALLDELEKAEMEVQDEKIHG